MTQRPEFGWLDGGLVPWESCTLHARSPGAFWGASVFEGIRVYKVADGAGSAFFRLREHLARLHRSARCTGLSVPYSDAELTTACADLLHANGLTDDAHVVIAVYAGLGESLDPLDPGGPAGVHITAIAAPPRPTEGGVAVCVSSWRRIRADALPPMVKVGANYQNSRLAHHEALRNGYDTALFLNDRGTLAEGPGSCLALVAGGQLISPPVTAGVLDGITLDAICHIAQAELGITTVRREIDRTELYGADEAFLAGTLHGLMPVVSADRIPVGTGEPGPLTRKLQDLYRQVARGHPGYQHWRTPLPARTAPQLSP
jgi:branched-chain amino acid aminotransferase